MYRFLHERRRNRSSTCHVYTLITHQRALFFADNQRFIGVLHKQNWATDERFCAWGNISCCAMLVIQAELKLAVLLLFGRDRLSGKLRGFRCILFKKITPERSKSRFWSPPNLNYSTECRPFYDKLYVHSVMAHLHSINNVNYMFRKLGIKIFPKKD